MKKTILSAALLLIGASAAIGLEIKGFTPAKVVVYKTIGDIELKVHIFNPAGVMYLHVRVKYDADEDGPRPCPLKDRRWYHVRCRHEIGSKWRGGIVKDVNVVKRRGKWFWGVTVSDEL